MSLPRRQSASDLTLRASGAILALLTFAATVSAASSGALPPAAIARVFIMTVDAGGGITEIASPSRDGQTDDRGVLMARVTRGVEAPKTARLNERLMDLPPPGV